MIHNTIHGKIDADLSVILKMREQLAVAAAENLFGEGYDISRIHLTFTNDPVDAAKVKTIEKTDLELMPAADCMCRKWRAFCFLPCCRSVQLAENHRLFLR